MDLGWFFVVFYSVIARPFRLSLDLSHVKQAKGEAENSNCSTAAFFYSVRGERKSNAFKSSLSLKNSVLPLVFF